MIDVYKYYRFIEDNDVQLLYKGPVNQEVLSSIMNVAEEKLRILKEVAPLKKRVFYVLVEMIQNSYLHMDKEINLGVSEDEDFTILCVLAKRGDTYKIIAGNYIKSENEEFLKEKLNLLSGLDEKALNLKYHETLTDKGYTEKGGAGLGLIDIYRKSKRKVIYRFNKVNKKFSFFSLEANIEK